MMVGDLLAHRLRVYPVLLVVARVSEEIPKFAQHEPLSRQVLDGSARFAAFTDIRQVRLHPPENEKGKPMNRSPTPTTFPRRLLSPKILLIALASAALPALIAPASWVGQSSLAPDEFRRKSKALANNPLVIVEDLGPVVFERGGDACPSNGCGNELGAISAHADGKRALRVSGWSEGVE